MIEIWKGKKIAEKQGYRLIPRFFDILYILENWDIINKISHNYDYHEKRFLVAFRKYGNNVGDAGFVDIADYIINIIKENPNEYEIIVHNVDADFGLKSREYLRKFLRNIFTFKKHKVYFHDVLLKSSLTTHELKFRVRKIPLVKSQSFVDKSTVQYYPGLRKMRKPIILGKGADNSLYVITEINNRPISYYISRMNKMPKINRIALRNHKVQYSFFKMLLNKGILIPDENSFYVVYMPFRLSKSQWARSFWRFSPIYLFNEKRMRANFNIILWNPILVDYDYDESNQVLLKFVDEMHRSILCGLDYKNMLWCIELPPITTWWRISKVYKYIYDLDEKTKVFNF